MPQYESESLATVVRGLIKDTRDLIREEIALARAEIRQEAAAARTVAASFAGAAVVGLIGLALLCLALGAALAYALHWPNWAGYGVIAVLLLGGAFALVRYGAAQLKSVRPLPKTRETIKENFAWIQGKSKAQ